MSSSLVSAHRRSTARGCHTVCWDSGSSCVCRTRPPALTPPCSDRCVCRIGRKQTGGRAEPPALEESGSGAAQRLRYHNRGMHTLLQIIERPGAASGRDGGSEHLANLMVEKTVAVDGHFPELFALSRYRTRRHRIASHSANNPSLHCPDVELAEILVAMADRARVVLHEVSARQYIQTGCEERWVQRHAHSLETRHRHEIGILSGKGVQMRVESVAHTDIYSVGKDTRLQLNTRMSSGSTAFSFSVIWGL